MAYLRGGFILDLWWRAKGISWKGRNTQGGRGPARARRVQRKGRQSVTMEEKSRRTQGQSVCVIPSLLFVWCRKGNHAKMTTRLPRAWQPRSSPVGTHHEHATRWVVAQR
jgi:hypothetical protein